MRSLPSERGSDGAPEDTSGHGVDRAWADQVARSGDDPVVVGGRRPKPPFEAWRHSWEDLDRLDPTTIVLLPRLEACLARNARDAARRGENAVPDGHVRLSYQLAWNDWAHQPRAAVLDTSDLTLQEVIAEVERLVSAVQ